MSAQKCHSAGGRGGPRIFISINVYGSDEEDVEALRSFKGGLLKSYKPEEDSERTLLPQEEGESKDECEIEETLQDLENRKCFRAGKLKKYVYLYLRYDIKFAVLYDPTHSTLVQFIGYLTPGQQVHSLF